MKEYLIIEFILDFSGRPPLVPVELLNGLLDQDLDQHGLAQRSQDVLVVGNLAHHRHNVDDAVLEIAKILS